MASRLPRRLDRQPRPVHLQDDQVSQPLPPLARGEGAGRRPGSTADEGRDREAGGQAVRRSPRGSQRRFKKEAPDSGASSFTEGYRDHAQNPRNGSSGGALGALPFPPPPDLD